MSESRFQKFVESHEATDSRLPFIHITNGYNFDRISLGDILKPSRCKVFSEDLLYFFYGRPSYKTKQTLNARLAFDWPVIFIFDYKKIDHLIRTAYPFDSGAFVSGRYKYFFDDDSDVNDFKCTRGEHNVTKIVSAFYRSNHEYFCGNSTKNVEIPLNEFEATGVHELARVPNHPDAPHHLKYDERSSSIEVILQESVPIVDNVDAILIARKFLDMPAWKEALERWKPKQLKTYSVAQNMTPDAFAGMIYSQVEGIIFDD